MSDLREHCPMEKDITPPGQVGNETWEIELRLSTYSSLSMDKIAPQKLVFTIKTDGFREASAVAYTLKAAYDVLFDIHRVSIQRIEKIGF